MSSAPTVRPRFPKPWRSVRRWLDGRGGTANAKRPFTPQLEPLEDRILMHSQALHGFHVELLDPGAMIVLVADSPAPAQAQVPAGEAAAHADHPHPRGQQSSGLSYVDPTFNAVESQNLTTAVGTFIDQAPGPAHSYQASIDWGDGTISTGTVAAGAAAGQFTVQGSHAYADEGTDNVLINVTTREGRTLQMASTVVVADAPLQGQPVAYTADPGTYNDVVGSFSDVNPQARPGDFLATIAWGDGSTSAGTVAGSNGLFTVNGRHSYTRTGTFTAAVSVQDTGGSTTSWNSTLYVGTSPASGGPALVGRDPTVNATEGTSFNGQVASFNDNDGNTNSGLYTASINWGDGSQASSGTVSGSGGANGFQVSGNHVYTEEGSYAVQVTITDSDNTTFNVTSTAVVADAALTLGQTYSATANAGGSFTAQLATFTDADIYGQLSDYSAVIAWGDGQSSAGSITSGASYTVSGTHTYAVAGTFTPQVTVTDAGGSTLTASPTVTVHGLVPQAGNLTLVVGAPVQNPYTVATFSDTDGNTNQFLYGATIAWGDGSSSSGTVVAGTGGTFQVQGGHTYTQQGYYQATISLTDNDGATASVQSNINVAHAALSATNTVPTGPQTSTTYTGQVATLADNDLDTNTADFTVRINWGDGNTSLGGLTSNGNGNFTVQGTHTYAGNGAYTVTTTITDADGSTALSTGTLTINAGGTLSVAGASNLTGTEGTALTNLTVATITDTDGNHFYQAYSATINWGDGTSSTTGTVSGSGPFPVTGSHTYADEGTYPITVSVTDQMDNATATGVTSIVIADAVLGTANRSLSATAGRPLNAATLGTFTDADTAASIHDFTALVNWGDNTPPTATAISGSAGSYTLAGGHIYATAGSYTATITVTDVGGQTATITDPVTVAAPGATLTANPVNATEAASYSGTVAAFTPATGTSGDTFVATLGWGDGAVTYATLTPNGGSFNLSGTHTYADETSANNPESLTVTVFDQTANQVAATATSAVTVSDATLAGTANAVTAWTSQSTGMIPVATFNDPNTAALASDFSASVTWGDGSAAGAGTVVSNGGGAFTVYAQHTYTTAGSDTVQTTVTDVGGATKAVSATATVAAATASLNATEGASFNGVVASFTGNPANAISATIVWGDGNSGPGTITSTGGNSFTVSGTHTYADEGVDNLSVTVQMSVGGPLTAAGPAVVADAALSGSAPSLSASVGYPLGFVAGQSDNPVTVASFTDANTAAPASDFTATVAWGDGTTSTGTVSASGPAGSFIVQANHTYVQPGVYTATTTIVDKGTLATTGQATVTVGIAEGQQDQAVLTLPLPDPVTTAPPSAYTATITWGDNSNSTAVATPVYTYSNGQLTGSLKVTAAHVYAASGTYTVSTTATNPDTNNSSSGSQTLVVRDALLNAVPQAVTAVAGNSTGTVTVGQFEDANTAATTGQFTASINWGDGSQATSGSIVAGTSGLFAVQGSHTYTNPGPDTITVTVTDTAGGKVATITSPATVVNAWAVGQVSNLPGARTSDPGRADLIPLGSATVDLNQGAVRISHALDFDQSPGTDVGGTPALAYNSATVSPRPVIQIPLQSDPNTGNPAATQISVQLTFNGVQQSAQNFSIASYQAGATYLLAAQVAGAVTQTGVYPWSAVITVSRGAGSPVTVNASGYTPVVVRDGSAYGAGWGIAGVPQLFPIAANGTVPAGVLWVTGEGDARFFTSNGNGTYSSPEDFGSLVLSGGVYTYTAKDQTQYNFTSAGLLSTVVQPDGLTRTYTFANVGPAGSAVLTRVQTPDGGTTNLSYDTNGFLYQIGEPGSRTVGLTQTEAQTGGVWQSTLTRITDVDATTRTLGYDTAHHLISDAWAPLNTTFTFDSGSGLLTGVTRGQGTTVPYTIVSAASNGLSAPSTSQPVAKVTDGNNHTTQYLLDLRGRLLQQVNPLGDTTTDQLNAAGDPVLQVDQLGRVTAETYGASEDLTQVTHADGSFTLYAYDAKYHAVTQTTNSLGYATHNTYDQTSGHLTSSTDALGNTTNYVWSGGRLQSQTDPLAHTVLFRYDVDLRQVAQIDSLGNWSLTSYDTAGNPSSTTDPLGRTTQTVYSGRGLLLKTTDANGDVTQEQYYADGALQTETNPRSFTRTTTIDARGLTTSQTDWLGNATTSQYDSAANQTSQTDPDNHTTAKQFDADNRPTSTTTPLGEQTQTQYDLAGNVTAIVDPTGATSHNYVDLLNRQVLAVDALGNNQLSVFDPAGNTLAQVSPTGAVSRTLLDADNRQIANIDAIGDVSQAQYDAAGHVVVTIDARGLATHYLVTADNGAAATIDPAGNVTRRVFDPAGEVVQTIDANAHAQTFTFDVVGRGISSTDADNNQSQTVFDPVGNTVQTIDANGHATLVTFDGDNRAVANRDPLGNVSRAAFDPAGNQVSATDAGGHVTNYLANADNEQTVIIDPNAHQTNTVYGKRGEVLAAYDGNRNGNYSGYNADGQATGDGLAVGGAGNVVFTATGQSTRVSDPDHNVNRILYNLVGWTVATVDPLGHFAYTAYNPDGQPTQQVDANGRTVNKIYDQAGRLTSVLWLSPAGAQVNASTYTFDPVGNLTGAGDGYGSYTFVVDPANRVTQQTDPFGLTLTIGYDPVGNVTSVAASSGGTETSVYDADNQLSSRRLTGGPGNSQLRMDLGYTALGQISTLTRYADTAATQQVGQTQDTYDPVGNLTETKSTNAAAGTLEDFQYTWDPGNRLGTETDTIGGAPITTNYGYDTTNQLTSAGAASYTFDVNGNRTMAGYQVGADNQVLADGIWTYKYDPAGNVLEKDGVAGGPDAGLTWKYAYDNANHLVVAAEYSSGTLQLQATNYYDVFGNQIEEDVYTASNAQTAVSKFAQQVAASPGAGKGQVWADLNATNQLVTRREYLNAVDAVFARVSQSGAEDWYLTDHLGSVRGLMNNSGSLDDAITYDAWGKTTSESNAAAGDRIKFDAQPLDSNLGMYHMGARWEDPATGRWTSPDPISFNGGDGNLYRYVNNAPTISADPSGEAPVPNFGKRGNYLLGQYWLGVLGQIPWTRVGGAVRAVFGCIEIMVGGASAPSGVGALVAVHGLDNVTAGVMTMWTGVYHQGVTEGAIAESLKLCGVADDTADQVAVGVDGAISACGATYARRLVQIDGFVVYDPKNPGSRPPGLGAPQGGVPANPGRPFPGNAQAGQTLTNIDPNTLQAGRGDLVAGRLTTQQQLIQQGTPRTTPIQVTPDGVIWDGNHGARAAAQAGVPVTVRVVPGTATGRGPVTGLPIRP